LARRWHDANAGAQTAGGSARPSASAATRDREGLPGQASLGRSPSTFCAPSAASPPLENRRSGVCRRPGRPPQIR
jgi:hypothetical protein